MSPSSEKKSFEARPLIIFYLSWNRQNFSPAACHLKLWKME